MNRAVSKMVEEALKYNQVESVLESDKNFTRNAEKDDCRIPLKKSRESFCKILAKKAKEIIDTKSSIVGWLNNKNVCN